jgi:hypothetical protein
VSTEQDFCRALGEEGLPTCNRNRNHPGKHEWQILRNLLSNGPNACEVALVRAGRLLIEHEHTIHDLEKDVKRAERELVQQMDDNHRREHDE